MCEIKKACHFFQNISHELRTPLTLIMNPLEDLRKEYPENQNALLADRNSKRLFRLVNQLLDFQKLKAGKKDINLQLIDHRYGCSAQHEIDPDASKQG